MRRVAMLAASALLAALPLPEASAADAPPLVLEATIRLADVGGRIDHMAIDLARKRLIVAELGNNTVEVIDLESSRVVHRLAGLKAPQGVGYVAAPDLIVVASADDGTVRLFHAGDFSPAGVIALGEDADNVRVDPASGRVVVGYGGGGLAVIDAAAAAPIAKIPLAAHPEGFQLDPHDGRVFVNVPDASHIAVVDRATNRQAALWKTPGLGANFPLAIAPDGSAVASVFRSPARLVLFAPPTGAVIAQIATCGDADDVFFDAARRRLYVSCGAGEVDVLQQGPVLERLARLPTASGARTSLFVPELDRLYVASRAGLLGSTASILVLRPLP
jgi:DNA-binding beta-propeller fold protein YncE